MTTDIKRLYTSNRMAIVNSLVTELKKIDGTQEFLTDVSNNVSPRLKFWDEVNDFPSLHVSAGSESRNYQGGGYKDRFLSVSIKCYVEQEDAVVALEHLMKDVETVIETNSRLAYTDSNGLPQHTHQISIVQIDTDEGVLEPIGVGELILQVQY